MQVLRREDGFALRSLHAPEHEVEGAILSVLSERSLGCLLDLGTGAGRMIELLRSGPSERPYRVLGG
nr:hypothetical protein [uncultured Neokomagataea sp.]